jgi:hypothetical protein
MRFIVCIETYRVLEGQRHAKISCLLRREWELKVLEQKILDKNRESPTPSPTHRCLPLQNMSKAEPGFKLGKVYRCSLFYLPPMLPSGVGGGRGGGLVLLLALNSGWDQFSNSALWDNFSSLRLLMPWLQKGLQCVERLIGQQANGFALWLASVETDKLGDL